MLALIGRGPTVPEIAAESSITVATAKVHVARLLTELDARDRAYLVITVYETGLVRASRHLACGDGRWSAAPVSRTSNTT
ncbi:hypothetical protein ACQPZ8_32850 [Actinomadura nitritigenes]|uniref:hypothetical protein n=1 Tax=Actinomadura nitritigenes TaxID=134602 RepID=UPI003D8DF0DD